MKNNIKVIFWGTPEFAVPALGALIKGGYAITAVVTAPDKPTGRKKELTPPPVKVAAQKYGLLVLQPETLKSDEQFEQFQQLKPDLCVVIAYGKIIPERYLTIPHLGFINIHPSLLPKYRGPSPIQTAILNGEKETGVTIMLMDKEADHGKIISNLKSQILNQETFLELSKKLSELGAELLTEILPQYLSGKMKPQEQNHDQATFTKKFTREDGKIYWDRPAEKIYNQIRALNPEPGTWTMWGDRALNIIEAVPTFSCSIKPTAGLVVRCGTAIAVGTQDAYLEIKKIQPAGGKIMDIKAFLAGHQNFPGSMLN